MGYFIDSESTLSDVFRDSSFTHPRNTALQIGDSSYSYQYVRTQADALAAGLLESGWGSGEQVPVALEATKSLHAYIGYLAILRLGHTVVPINTVMPAERLASVVQASGIRVALVDRDTSLASWRELGVTACRISSLISRGLAAVRLHSFDGINVLCDQPAYLLFTSGSTGRPKGVPISHRNAVAYLKHSIATTEITSESRLSHTFDLTFDPSVFDLFAAWATGATLVVPEGREALLPVKYVNDRKITHWFSVPSIISIARQFGSLKPNCMPTLRWSQFIGEPLTLDQAGAWWRAAPNSTIENVYGPTELTVACSGYRLPSSRKEWPSTSNGTVPIGDIYPGLDFFIADECGHSCVDGELLVRGLQRFAGYLDRSDNVARFAVLDGEVMRFETNTTEITPDLWYRTGDRVSVQNNHLVHLGRLDRQVKVRGRRIELGEIEAALRAHPGVNDSVVTVAESDVGGAELRALCTGDWDDERELARFLASKLPDYMIPRRYLRVSSLPLGANGKLDLKKVEGMCSDL